MTLLRVGKENGFIKTSIKAALEGRSSFSGGAVRSADSNPGGDRFFFFLSFFPPLTLLTPTHYFVCVVYVAMQDAILHY